jgi:Icc-related predicted phosphoesterase
MIKQVNEKADLLLLCGDLTDKGTLKEATTLGEELAALRVPCVAVLGNHDYEQGTADPVIDVLTKIGVHVLDGDYWVFEHMLGIAGIKGYGGGYANATLQAFGEGNTKAFVQEAVNESLKLEAALGQLDTEKRVVIMHYCPIVGTTEGENPEIRAFLGTSRLAGPIERYGAEAVFHGHAHHGSLQGKTDKGIPVYNVALPLLRKHSPEQRFALLEV